MSTDAQLWTVAPRFGVAGGPEEVILTREGEERAFSVGAQVRRGPAADALEALWSAMGEGYLEVRDGARVQLTDLGRRFDQIAWGRLRALGYVESMPPTPETGDGVRLTEAGKRAAWNGIQERARLLERCRQEAASTPRR